MILFIVFLKFVVVECTCKQSMARTIYIKIYLKNKKIYMKKGLIMKSANKSKSQNDNAIFINIKNQYQDFLFDLNKKNFFLFIFDD